MCVSSSQRHTGSGHSCWLEATGVFFRQFAVWESVVWTALTGGSACWGLDERLHCTTAWNRHAARLQCKAARLPLQSTLACLF